MRYNTTNKQRKSWSNHYNGLNKIIYLCDHLSKAYDSMGIIIGWDNDGHLTTKADLGTTLWMLQSHTEILLLFRDVVVYDVHCDL